jgi:hypothetical protein
MYRKVVALLIVVVLLATLVGCSAHTHVVGDGARGGQTIEARQWYILWGLVPINEVDTSSMAGNETNYTIKTEASVLDIIINIFTQWVTVTSRTVTVTR